MIQLLIEAFIVGIVLILISYIFVFIFYKFIDNNVPKKYKIWDNNIIINTFLFFIPISKKLYKLPPPGWEITLFCIGVFTHFFFEFTGLNKWYCLKGFACNR